MTSFYTNPRGLYPFQARLTAMAVLRQNNIAVVDTGLGKTHIGLATAAFCLEDGLVDRVVFLIEQNKWEEFIEDFATFTTLPVNPYYGPKRQLDDRLVTLSTHFTARDDMARKHPKDPRALAVLPGPMVEHFRGLRLLLVIDEAGLFGGEGSRLHHSLRVAIEEWRKSAEVRTLLMTATPMTSSPLNYYNLCALIDPSSVGTRAEFLRNHVVKVDRRGKPYVFKDLDKFAERVGPLLLRKRKTDPDVIAQFPQTTERFVKVKLHQSHRAAYASLDDFISELPDFQSQLGFNALSALTCHPRAPLASQSAAIQEWVADYGAERLSKIPSMKSAQVIAWVNEIMGQGDDRVLVFCRSVAALRATADDISAHSIFPFVSYHGQQHDKLNEESKAAFKDGAVRVMLVSSKGERGINLPEATYVANLDVPFLHSSYLQRFNRASRIGHNVGGLLTVKTFVATGTVEHGALKLWQRRNEWSDQIQDIDTLSGQTEFITAQQRWQRIRQEMEAA